MECTTWEFIFLDDHSADSSFEKVNRSSCSRTGGRKKNLSLHLLILVFKIFSGLLRSQVFVEPDEKQIDGTHSLYTNFNCCFDGHIRGGQEKWNELSLGWSVSTEPQAYNPSYLHWSGARKIYKAARICRSWSLEILAVGKCSLYLSVKV